MMDMIDKFLAKWDKDADGAEKELKRFEAARTKRDALWSQLRDATRAPGDLSAHFAHHDRPFRSIVITCSAAS